MTMKKNFDYDQITDQQAPGMTKEHLLFLYNDAVEMIWHLNARILQLQEENEAVWKSYDDISKRFFG